MHKNGFVGNVHCWQQAFSAATPIGGDQGWYVVYCNVNGASVYFDGVLQGQKIPPGNFTVPVYSTGTPYQKTSLSSNGGLYNFRNAPVTQYPAKGKTS